MDTLTKDDVATLTRHFRPEEHEFLRGFTYISEQAVTARLDEVDPAWTLTILDTHQRNEQIVVTARLTIKGVSRDGVGMQKIERKETTDEKTGEIKPFESGEPEKGAATDALKRAARLFGIGRYLLDLPSGTNSIQALSRWLAQNGGSARPTPPQPNIPRDPQPSSNGKHEPEVNSKNTPALLLLNDLIESPDLKQWIDQVNHRRATVNALAKNGLFAKCETTPDMVAIVRMYLDERAKGTPQEKPADKAIDAVKRTLGMFASLNFETQESA